MNPMLFAKQFQTLFCLAAIGFISSSQNYFFCQTDQPELEQISNEPIRKSLHTYAARGIRRPSGSSKSTSENMRLSTISEPIVGVAHQCQHSHVHRLSVAHHYTVC
jgi:hypothetical protein